MTEISWMIFSVMWAFSLMATKQDLETHSISDLTTIPFAVFGIIQGVITGHYISCAIAILMILWVIFFPDKIYGIGDADILLYAGLIGYYYISGLIFMLVVTNGIALVMYVIAAKKAKKHSTEVFDEKDEDGNEIEVNKPAVPYAPAIFVAMPILQYTMYAFWYPIITQFIANVF